MAQLPPIVGESLPTPHFPTQAQCLIYRLWNIISPERLAAVLHTDVNTVLSAASDMGLTTDADEHTYDNWLQKGYITIIRAVWHLLNYDQIMQLLDWDEEKLAFILHEDDFLDIKLGENKPYCEPIYWRTLSEREKEQTAKIRDITVQALKQLPPVKCQPFSFYSCLHGVLQKPMHIVPPQKTITPQHRHDLINGSFIPIVPCMAIPFLIKI